jgi:sodium transport system permease protein
VLLPLVVLFSALALAISSFAASYKEGNAYLTPLLLVGTCAPLAAGLPGMRLDPATCLIPGVSAALLLRELMAGTAGAGQVLLVVGSTLVWAALAVRWAASLYEQEDVLLRPVSAPGPDLLGVRERRAAPRVEGRVPTLPQALALGALALGLLALVGPDLQQRHVAGGIVATFMLLVLLPTLAYGRLLGCDLRATFALRAPPLAALLAAVLLAAALFLLGPDLHALQEWLTGPLTPEEERALAGRARELERLGPAALLLLLALLPAVCEELLFRGFVLQGLRRAGGGGGALLGSACLFGLAHLDPGRLLLTLGAGLLLAGLVLRGGSLWPAMLLHVLHNGSALFADSAPLAALRADPPGALQRGLGAGALLAGLALLWLSRPRAAPPAGN